MLHADIDPDRNIVTVSPEGKVSQEDFEMLSNTISGYINEADKVPALVIETRHLPHWDSFAALLRHIKLVRTYEKVIPKVAIISDSKILQIAPSLADHFVKAKIRHFTAAHREAALDWVVAPDDHPGSFELIPGLPDNVVAIEAKGIVTAQDYEEMLVPLIAEKLKVHDHLNILLLADEDFQSCSAGAVWDDTKFGLMHLADFGKIALVSDTGWLRHGAKLFAPFMRGNLHVFSLAELDDAKEWIKS